MSQSGTPAANLAMDQAGQNTPLGETTPEQQTFYPSSMAGALLGEQIVGTPRGGNIGTFPQPTNRPPAGHKTLSGGQNYERLQQQRQQLLGGQQTGGSTSTVDMQDQQGGGSQQDQQGSAGFYGRSGRGMSNLGRPQSATAPLFGGSNAGGLARSGSSFPRQQSLFGGAQSQQQQSSLQALRQELAHLREMVHQLTGGAAGANGQMMMGGSRLSRSLTALPAFGGSQAGGVSAYRANYRDGGYGSTGYANYRAGYAPSYADAYADQQYGQYAQQNAPWGEDAAQGAYDYAYPDDEDDYACGDGMYREQMRANQYAGQGYRAGNQYGDQGYRAGYRAGGSVSTMGGFRAPMGQGYRAGSY